MRAFLVAVLVALPAVALASPPISPAPSTHDGASNGLTLVQNRFLPGFLQGGENKSDDMAVRLDQLEAQVRMLTGQVEQLTFTVRRLEAALAGGQPQLQERGALPPGAVPGPGTPPRDLGSLPAPANPQTATAPPPALPSGPIDLSVLNQGVTGPTTAPPPATAPAALPQSTALANARTLQSSGRYAMAAQEARAVLADNPSGPVSSEARFLLGEALLAQGDFRGAANQFLENYTSDPNSARAPMSLLKLSTALNGLGEREAACSSLEELFGAYPNVDPAVRAAAERERAAANCA